MMRDAMEHIERCTLPWQSERLTECGKPIAEFATVLSRTDAARKFREQGKQRAAMTTCMTCLNRGSDQPLSWEGDPAAVMRRACERLGWRVGQDHPMNVELRALALLVQAHRDEFDQAIRDLTGAVSLAEIRRAKAPRPRQVGRSL
jgi:hypothetical protein